MKHYQLRNSNINLFCLTRRAPVAASPASPARTHPVVRPVVCPSATRAPVAAHPARTAAAQPAAFVVQYARAVPARTHCPPRCPPAGHPIARGSTQPATSPRRSSFLVQYTQTLGARFAVICMNSCKLSNFNNIS